MCLVLALFYVFMYMFNVYFYLSLRTIPKGIKEIFIKNVRTNTKNTLINKIKTYTNLKI
jgi:hypothetical protein